MIQVYNILPGASQPDGYGISGVVSLSVGIALRPSQATCLSPFSRKRKRRAMCKMLVQLLVDNPVEIV